MNMVKWLASGAALVLAVQPALAADDFRYLEARPEHRSAAFAGAQFRMLLSAGGQRRQRPTARLQLGVEHVYQDGRSPAAAVRHRTSSLELGFSNEAAPTVFVAGAPARELERRLGISTGGAIAIGAAVVLVAVLAAAAAAGPPDDITP